MVPPNAAAAAGRKPAMNEMSPAATAPDWARFAEGAIVETFADATLLAGARTPFVDYNGALALVSPTDLGIHAARPRWW